MKLHAIGGNQYLFEAADLELAGLLRSLNDAVELGADHGGGVSELRRLIGAHLRERRANLARLTAAYRTAIARSDPPPVMLGPGGDYVTTWPRPAAPLVPGHNWPEHTAELIGGDPQAAVNEVMPQEA